MDDTGVGASEINSSAVKRGMDRPVTTSGRWFARWPLPVKVGAVSSAVIVALLAALRLVAGSGESTIRTPRAQLIVSTVKEGIFHDLVALRARVEPRETVYVDAIDGGRVDRVLVEPGDRVQKGQPLI